MRLTKKLLSFLHRVFDKDPLPFVALRLRYNGAGMTWSVADARLTTAPVGGPGGALSVDLTAYTLGQLVSYLAAQPGYVTTYVGRPELLGLQAAVLLDAAGDIAKPDGDALYGYTSLLWSYLESSAGELASASDQIGQMLRQMVIGTASDVWLDELGGYYAVPRLQGELDQSYALRIVAEVLRPRGNNVAIESAIAAYTGQATTVTDVASNTVALPQYSGAITHDGSHYYNATATPFYGLFDVAYGYDIINGGDIGPFHDIVAGLIERLRDAGTHLRALSLAGSVIADSLNPPTDGATTQSVASSMALTDTLSAPGDVLSSSVKVATMADTLTPAADDLTLSVTTNYLYNGARYYNGAIAYRGGGPSTETV